jgi:hypothetical protein
MVMVLTATAAQAAEVAGCDDDWRLDLREIGEPWEAHTRTFANGDVRAVVVDTVEPAAGSFYLVVLHPPYSEFERGCALISLGGYVGFAGIDLAAAEAGYDPAKGLTLAMPVGRYDEASARFVSGTLRVTVNQVSGEVTAATE